MYYEMTIYTLQMHNSSFVFIIQFRIYVIFDSIIRSLISLVESNRFPGTHPIKRNIQLPMIKKILSKIDFDLF